MTDVKRLGTQALRLLEDEAIQEQIGRAIADLRRGSRRARSQKATDAIRDRKLHEAVRSAAEALTQAGRALAEPPRRRHPVRWALVLAALAAAGAFAWQRLSSARQTERGSHA